VKEATEEVDDEIFARADGGTISIRAETRSKNDSESWRSWSEATEISESGAEQHSLSVGRGMRRAIYPSSKHAVISAVVVHILPFQAKIKRLESRRR
jgi:hypothetical protein